MSVWGVGGTMVLYLAALQEVPKELYEVADLDGASTWHKIRHVTMPMISPVLFFTLVMGLISALQVFTQAYIMTKGGPGSATLFYCLYLFQNAFEFFRLGYASAMAWILFAIIVTITAIVFKLTGRFIYYEGEHNR
jgi:multiple sugar transport system permease protein